MAEERAAEDVKAPAGIGPSVRTTFRRTLAFAGIAGVAAFVVVVLYQLACHSVSAERYLRYMEAVGFFERHHGFPSEDPALVMAAGLVVGAAGTVMAMLFRRRRDALVILAVFAVAAGAGHVFLSIFFYVSFGMQFAALGLAGWIIEVPLGRVENADLYRLAFWRRFRLRSLVWPVLSGVLLFYLGVMGCFLALDFGLNVVFELLGADAELGPFGPPGGRIEFARVLYRALLASGMMLYLFLCSSYLVNQLDYLVDAGKDRIRHREFWWPFKRASNERRSAPTGTATQETSAP